MNVSIAMTTYNGEKYILEQINSIINQLNKDDEIIICDDGSVDGTIKIIENLMQSEKRIKLYKNQHKGVVRNFEDAISRCNNDIIFLSDQDDIWLENKVKEVKEFFKNNNKSLVLHNAVDFTENNIDIEKELIQNMYHGVYRNIYKSCYWGCCMAFKKEFVKYIIPFPKNIVAHDQWIGLIAEARNESGFINEPLIKHRRHNNNVSKKLPLIQKLKFRLNLFIRFKVYQFKQIKDR